MTKENQRIFIVEDEVVVAFEMSDTLEDMGFQVVGPSVHLEDAKRKAKEGNIDVAFLDVNLGKGKTSEPIAEILRARGIPFVFITAYDRDQVAFISDDDQVLKKPITGQALAATLNRVITPKP